MKLKLAEHKHEKYRLIFEDEMEGTDGLAEIEIIFNEDWKLEFKYWIGPMTVRFNHDFKEALAKTPIHIPNPKQQFFFRACMNLLIKETSMPAHVGTADHPGYLLTVITFDPKVIDNKKMEKILERIMGAIQGAKVSEIEKPKQEEETEVDPLEDIDEAVIVEFEVEDEIKQLSHFFEIEPEEDTKKFPSGYEGTTEDDERNDD